MRRGRFEGERVGRLRLRGTGAVLALGILAQTAMVLAVPQIATEHRPHCRCLLPARSGEKPRERRAASDNHQARAGCATGKREQRFTTRSCAAHGAVNGTKSTKKTSVPRGAGCAGRTRQPASLAISEPRWTSRGGKCHLGSGLNQRDRAKPKASPIEGSLRRRKVSMSWDVGSDGEENPRPRHSKECPADLFRRWRGLATGTDTEPGFG